MKSNKIVSNHQKLSLWYCNITNMKYVSGPNVASLNDFWQMIWEQDISVIVITTNLIEKNKVDSFIIQKYSLTLYFEFQCRKVESSN